MATPKNSKFFGTTKTDFFSKANKIDASKQPLVALKVLENNYLQLKLK